MQNVPCSNWLKGMYINNHYAGVRILLYNGRRMNMKTTTTEIKAGSALKALENVRTWYAGLNIAFVRAPTCASVGCGLYAVTVRTD